MKKENNSEIILQPSRLEDLKNPLQNRIYFTDILTINSIQSFFLSDYKDPYSEEMLPIFIDLYIYSDKINFPINFLNDKDPEDAFPQILKDLYKIEKNLFSHVTFPFDDNIFLNMDFAKEMFIDFANFSKTNKIDIVGHMMMHRQDWLKSQRDARIGKHNYIFSIEEIQSLDIFKDTKSKLKIETDDIIYLFDVTLRYAIYGSMAEGESPYITHPLRSRLNRQATNSNPVGIEPLPLPIGTAVSPLVKKMTYWEFIVFLYETRKIIHDYGINRLRPGEVDQETAREICMKMTLPPRLKQTTKYTSISASIIGAAGAYAIFGSNVAAVGALISAIPSIWTGNLPRGFGKNKWMSGILEWDLEKAVQKYKDLNK